MKNSTAFYLLIIYTLALSKPVLPLVQDKMAHVFRNAQHIATVHQHHGQNHVDKEVMAALHSEGNQAPVKITSPENVSVHLIYQSLFTNPRLLPGLPSFHFPAIQFFTVIVARHYPPPRWA